MRLIHRLIHKTCEPDMAHSFGLSILVLLLLTAEAIGAEFTGMVVGVIAGLIPRPSIYEQRAHLYNSRWYMYSPGRLHFVLSLTRFI